MGEVPRYVVDASTVLKWQFHAESGSQEATDLVTDYVRGRVSLLGPPHLPYEVSSAIRRRILDREITLDAGRQYLSDFLALRIPTIEPAGMASVALDLSIRHTLSLYDALYVALAQIVFPIDYQAIKDQKRSYSQLSLRLHLFNHCRG